MLSSHKITRVALLGLSLITTKHITAQQAPTDMVKVRDYITDAIADLRYSTPHNFAGYQLYPTDAKCYLRRGTLEKLKRAADEFRALGYRIKIWDAYRPRAVQYKLWEILPDPQYVGDPTKGSIHNRGSAVDVTLTDMQGRDLFMPTRFDDFSKQAHHDCMAMPQVAIDNRQLLKNIMEKHGLKSIRTEWWHFNDTDWRDYELLDVPFEEL